MSILRWFNFSQIVDSDFSEILLRGAGRVLAYDSGSGAHCHYGGQGWPLWRGRERELPCEESGPVIEELSCFTPADPQDLDMKLN